MAKKWRAESGLPSGVTELRNRIDGWRRTRARRTAMPATMWSRAIALARKSGRAYAVAKALGINYDTLKRRMAEHGAGSEAVTSPPLAPPPSRAFVELSGAQLLGEASSEGWVVELSEETGAGSRVTVRLSRHADLDVAELIAALRRRGDA